MTIFWDFEDYKDFEDSEDFEDINILGQLDLLKVYFPLKSDIFLFDLEISAQQRIYVCYGDIFQACEVSHQKVKCHISWFWCTC